MNLRSDSIDTPSHLAVATNGVLKGVDFQDAGEAGQQLVALMGKIAEPLVASVAWDDRGGGTAESGGVLRCGAVKEFVNSERGAQDSSLTPRSEERRVRL